MRNSLNCPMNFYFILLIISVSLNVGGCAPDGNPTNEDHFKYHVYLRNSVYLSCSGVVIDEWHILTSAHCVYRNTPSELVVYAGTIILRAGLTEIYEVQKISVHRDYETSGNLTLEKQFKPWPFHRANDIAALTLETPLLLGMYIKGTLLPRQAMLPFTSTKCSIIHWDLGRVDGVFDTLFARQSLSEVIVTSTAFCKAFGITVRDNELCVADQIGVKRVHNIETGGGLVCDGLLVGIISTTNAHADKPIINTHLYHFLNFITEITNGDRGFYCSLR